MEPHRLSNPEPTAAGVGLAACHSCGLLMRMPQMSASWRCPRCQAAVHSRKPASLARTWALLISATILYLPANLLPIMHTTTLGRSQADTIVTGVKFLIAHGMWPLALIVFVASVLVPVTKILVLGYLLVSIQLGSNYRPDERTRYYRFTEFVGRWSMVDVYVVTILVALVHVGNLAEVRAGSGAIFFAAVVILTMLAAMTFDPRLIWDARKPLREA